MIIIDGAEEKKTSRRGEDIFSARHMTTASM